ncbi:MULTISPECIES: nucleotide pyrophosphohydrolase [unclassified Imperialibacter]|uniref:nucleotide pyrophosphohydrolase n=1 Tax=unclassified Imperialibacter TaxID=2629706 RepID=UPI00125B3B08|nr:MULTISPECIES: nucleotide pyrophosphohydrolase [unclassified Imperialibacter]CAD5258738.1 Nucleotide pyrophosphohydrolase [Imperialibacter sp. 75]CAD5261880.1 Nucleotide pyrophosphohydrolase [Imperialibacter sp. 89]VVT19982.1 Nucleotide pyrophosphohydrolase [Imperialibacter sp. EC-SDR9]
MGSEIVEIIDRIRKFRDERDWQQFHDPKNLAVSLSVESAELLQTFLWRDASEANLENVKEELADVFYSAFLLADTYQLDVKQIIFDKLEKNAAKYPVDKAKGSNRKWDEL